MNNKVVVTLLADQTRTRIRIPAQFANTHPHYKVLVNPNNAQIIIRLQRNEDDETRPAPQSGSYMVSVHGAIKQLYRCPPACNQDLTLDAKIDGSMMDIVFPINTLSKMHEFGNGTYLVRDVIGRS